MQYEIAYKMAFVILELILQNDSSTSRLNFETWSEVRDNKQRWQDGMQKLGDPRSVQSGPCNHSEKSAGYYNVTKDICNPQLTGMVIWRQGWYAATLAWRSFKSFNTTDWTVEPLEMMEFFFSTICFRAGSTLFAKTVQDFKMPSASLSGIIPTKP